MLAGPLFGAPGIRDARGTVVNSQV